MGRVQGGSCSLIYCPLSSHPLLSWSWASLGQSAVSALDAQGHSSKARAEGVGLSVCAPKPTQVQFCLTLSRGVLASTVRFSQVIMLLKIPAVSPCYKMWWKHVVFKEKSSMNPSRGVCSHAEHSVFSSSPRSAAGGRWRSTGRQRGSRGSCNKNKHISCLYSMTTGGRPRSTRSRPSPRCSRSGANRAITLPSPSRTTTLQTEPERYLSPPAPGPGSMWG